MIETTTLDIYRPFGDSTPTTEGTPCRFSNQFIKPNITSVFPFTHSVEIADDVDIRDGATRSAESNDLVFADGDEVRITGGGLDPATRFVVVWVDRIINAPGQAPKKIAYLLRHSAAWPGP